MECPAFDLRRTERQATSGEDQAPIVYAEARGANVTDVDGNRYVDLVGGFGAQTFGHAPREISARVKAQMDVLPLALGDVYGSPVKTDFMTRLVAIFPEPGARVLLGLTGADAVTAAMKTAALARGSRILAFEGGYHGLSHGPLAACGLSERFRQPFVDQMGTHVTFTPYPRTEPDLEKCILHVHRWAHENPSAPGAIFVEPILGRGGCVVPPLGFLPALRDACDQTGALLLVDEIWTGMGRTGERALSFSQGIVPDVVCFGKGLGAGFPVSACVGRAVVMDAWGAHGGGAIHTATHFGLPLGCAAGIATLEALTPELCAHVRELGASWIGEMKAGLRHEGIREIRGVGLMVGIECDSGARAVRWTRRLLERGYIVLTGGRGGEVLTLTPPLTIASELLSAFTREFANLLRQE